MMKAFLRIRWSLAPSPAFTSSAYATLTAPQRPSLSHLKRDFCPYFRLPTPGYDRFESICFVSTY